MKKNIYCEYYQAEIVKNMVWFVTGCLKAEDNWAFERAVTGTGNVIEFFVSPYCEEDFLKLMNNFDDMGILVALNKLPNRFIEIS